MHKLLAGEVPDDATANRPRRWLTSLGSLALAQAGRAAPRPLAWCLGLTLGCVALAVTLNSRLLADRQAPLGFDQHSLLSLDLAVNRAEFGTPSHTYNPSGAGAPDFRTLVGDDTALLGQEVRSLPQRLASSRDDYRQRLAPFLNNENSLMLLNVAFLRLLPHLTMNGLIHAHVVLKLACVAIFVFVLLRIGASPLLALAVAYLSALIIQRNGERFPIGLYPYLMPLTMLLIALFSGVLRYGAHCRIGIGILALVVIGFYGAFFVNLRTSYFPVVLAFLLLYAGFVAVDLWRDRSLPRWRWAALTFLPLLAFAGGFRLFTASFITPLHAATAETAQVYDYHVIGHPLVVCLGIPPACDLTQREGIRCEDPVGLVIARRIDPTVQYLGPNYDSALLTYYCKLWLYYPQEMLALYQARLRTAGASLWPLFLNNAKELGHRQGLVARWIGAPLRLLPDGFAYLLMFAVLALLGLCSVRFLNVGAAFAVTAIASGGALLLIESAIFTPWFILGYHNCLLFLLLATGLLMYQVGANTAVWMALASVRGTHRLIVSRSAGFKDQKDSKDRP